MIIIFLPCKDIEKFEMTNAHLLIINQFRRVITRYIVQELMQNMHWCIKNRLAMNLPIHYLLFNNILSYLNSLMLLKR